ncbi:unnamed protein product [Hymenolepis diminuta]|uniref:Uncharacterized protein n=1 Tax=Hymenolepis diminuta TaxID=6216 RepID=A0A564Z3X6_HYMDI|nr:unnamed protein product [Hymenolepis diminuta]
MFLRSIIQVTHIKLLLVLSDSTHRSGTLLSLFLSLSLSLLLVMASLNTFLVCPTLDVLLHKCC